LANTYETFIITTRARNRGGSKWLSKWLSKYRCNVNFGRTKVIVSGFVRGASVQKLHCQLLLREKRGQLVLAQVHSYVNSLEHVPQLLLGEVESSLRRGKKIILDSAHAAHNVIEKGRCTNENYPSVFGDRVANDRKLKQLFSFGMVVASKNNHFAQDDGICALLCPEAKHNKINKSTNSIAVASYIDMARKTVLHRLESF